MSVLTVGLGQQYTTLSAAVAASVDGDVLQLQAGTYVNDFAEITTKITIEGVNGMANLVADGPIPNGKAILVTDTDVTINHISFSGATVADGNGAGIRYQGGNLVITNSLFHNNQNGILGADDPAGSISISDSEFAQNGSGTGFTHGIYIGDVGQLTVTDSYFHDTSVGHEIKSRAETTMITGSRVADGPNGTASYVIDLPNGGNALIQGNVVEKGPLAQNPVMITFGEEGGVYASSSLQVTGNTILDDQHSALAIGVRNDTGVQAIVSDNTVFGLTSQQLLQGPGVAVDNTFPATEPTYSTDSPFGFTVPSLPNSLPEPGSVALLAAGAVLALVIGRRYQAAFLSRKLLGLVAQPKGRLAK